MRGNKGRLREKVGIVLYIISATALLFAGVITANEIESTYQTSLSCQTKELNISVKANQIRTALHNQYSVVRHH